MHFLFTCLRLILAIFLICSYLVTASLIKIIFHNPKKRRIRFTKNVTFFTKIMLKCLNAHLKVINLPHKTDHYLFVGNHMGFLDILFLSSVRPSLFITSVEMQQTPLLGTLCEMGGCLFVERRSRSKIHQEIENIREKLREGFNLVLYPEGTSTDGSKVLPFKKSLLTAAAGTGVPIMPVVLNFISVNGEPVSKKWRDHVCWYGDHSFVAAMWRLLSTREIKASLEFLHPIHVHSEEERTHVAEKAHDMITKKFIPIV
jgi:1-acyl-sn-glycerol-3-phosphate acyltransferase